MNCEALNPQTGRPYPGEETDRMTEREKRNMEISREAAAQGMVLLENDGVLPLRAGASVALYGQGARHPYAGGTGSGEVNARRTVSVEEGLVAAGIRIANAAWLDRAERRRAEAISAWKQKVLDLAGGDRQGGRLFEVYAANPLHVPAGEPITGGDGAETAIYILSRIAGEGADRKAAPGDYYLSDAEREELRAVCAAYPKVVVVLNVGGVMDLSFMDELPVSALVLMSQAGSAGGHALADVLTARVPFSGHLTDTWAYRYADWPSSEHFSHNDGNVIREYYTDDIYVGYRYFDSFGIRPRYPFGYGLTYTRFGLETVKTALDGGEIAVTVRVTNAGGREGREVVQVYASCPSGLRRKERKRLIGFAKTGLLQPGETAQVTVRAPLSLLASWHTGRAAWFLDGGCYTVEVGEHAGCVAPAARLTLGEACFFDPLGNICPLQDALHAIAPAEGAEAAWEAELARADVPVLPMEPALAAAAEQLMPVPARPDPDLERAKAVAAELTLEQKAVLLCGRPRDGEPSMVGEASVTVPGAAAETTSILKKRFGLEPMILADGPAGLRLEQRYEIDPADGHIVARSYYESLFERVFGERTCHEGMDERWQFCTAIPIGTLLAQTFDIDVVERCGRVIAEEMGVFGVHLWLAPGMNIHRNPLCGRNFEYYSEDPLVSGLMAAAVTRGVQSRPGCGVTIKHFACNNQEENRRGVSSVVSERALREIYLKGFELAVRLSRPAAIMTSYNKINGVHTANSRDLCTRAAREAWGFDGVIMTDWSTTNHDGGSSAAKCVAAGNDLVMPGTVRDIREIVDAAECRGDQSLSLEALDACVLRVLSTTLRLTQPRA